MKPTRITGVLNYKISTDVFDRTWGQVACFAAGVLVLALSFWKLTRLELTEAQLFLGVLLSLAVPLLCILIGLVLPMTTATRK